MMDDVGLRPGAGGSWLSQETRAWLSSDHQLYVNGQAVAAVGGGSMASYDPSTGDCIATVAAGQAADIDKAVAAARTAFDRGVWWRLPPSQRAATLLRLADRLEDRIDLFAEIESVDNGMSLATSRSMVAMAAGLFRYYAGWVGKIAGEAFETQDQLDREVTSYTQREPIGVAGLILPWNFPLAIAAMKLAPALAAGCSVVMKPAEQTPLSTLLLADTARNAGIPDGVINVVNGLGETAGAALASHLDVDKIAFTGSTEVGRLILAAAAGNLKKVSLELGGKAPFIVLGDADLDRAAKAAVTGAFRNQGQNCVSASRIYVGRSLESAFIAKMVEISEGMRIGPANDAEATLGPLISEAHLERVLDYVRIGLGEGATLSTGGARIDSRGCFMSPTVFSKVHSGMRIMREEIFGPVTCIEAFDTSDIDEIAALANDTDYGLVASVWTQDISKAHRLVRRIRAGTVSINAHSHPGLNAPFGGYKQSGWGREYGRAALESYLETKTIAVYA